MNACWIVSWLSPLCLLCSFVSRIECDSNLHKSSKCCLPDDDDCAECEEILEELEEIDGEADMFGIDFVKIASVEAAKKYEIVNIPSLVYFR